MAKIKVQTPPPSHPTSKLSTQQQNSSFSTLFIISIAILSLSILAYVQFLPSSASLPSIPTKFDLLHPNTQQQDITHWLIGKQIGKGGYSRVFLGKRTTIPGSSQFLPSIPTSPHDNTTISNALTEAPSTHAIKVIHKARYFRQSQDPTSKRFQNLSSSYLSTAIWSERNSWVAFSSPRPIPYILPLSHIFQETNALYYLTPLINGGDLDTSLGAFGPMNERTIRYYTASIVTALEGMHARGYTYKDIKLKNLLLDEQGKLQVTDFGLTRFSLKNPASDTSDDADVNCVTEGIIGKAGTKSYKAPEVLDGRGHSFPSDFYSLGVVLYKMLTGFKLYDTKKDSPELHHYLRIPKYHAYNLRSQAWKTFGVHEFYSHFQRELQDSLIAEENQSNSTDGKDNDTISKINIRDKTRLFDVLDYTVQKDLMVKWIQKSFKKYQSKIDQDPDTLTENELFVDGEGPIFSPAQAKKFRTGVDTGQVINEKGDVHDQFAWLSLTDESVDFLTQLTDLNPFFRLGTNNRYYRDWNNPFESESEESSHQPPKPTSKSTPRDAPTFPSQHRDFIHSPSITEQDYAHTHPALIDFEEFDFETDVIGLAEYEKVIEKQPQKHCFKTHTDVTKAIPNFHIRDKITGKWTGLHNGFAEIKNHSWFKNFDWEKMTEIILPQDPTFFSTPEDKEKWIEKQSNIQGHQKVQFSNFDVKNSAPRHKFPTMIDADQDTWDHDKYQYIFDNLEFNTRL